MEGDLLHKLKEAGHEEPKSKLARKNAERSAELIEKAVKSIAEHGKLLKREAADPIARARLASQREALHSALNATPDGHAGRQQQTF
jgi:hypothetical protein